MLRERLGKRPESVSVPTCMWDSMLGPGKMVVQCGIRIPHKKAKSANFRKKCRKIHFKKYIHFRTFSSFGLA